MCLENLREVVDKNDFHILVCDQCDHRCGHPSSGYSASDPCPFCREGVLRMDTKHSVEQVHPPAAESAA